MDDFVQRFGQQQAGGTWVLSSSRQSIITSLISAGYASALASNKKKIRICIANGTQRPALFVGALGQVFTSDRFISSLLGRPSRPAPYTPLRNSRSVGSCDDSSTPFHLTHNNVVAIVPLYNGETARKAMRGMLLVLYQLQIIFGFVVCRVLRYYRRSR